MTLNCHTFDISWQNISIAFSSGTRHGLG